MEMTSTPSICPKAPNQVDLNAPTAFDKDKNFTIPHKNVRYHEIAIRSGCSNQRHGSRHIASTETSEVGNTRSGCSRDIKTVNKPCARLLQVQSQRSVRRVHNAEVWKKCTNNSVGTVETVYAKLTKNDFVHKLELSTHENEQLVQIPSTARWP